MNRRDGATLSPHRMFLTAFLIAISASPVLAQAPRNDAPPAAGLTSDNREPVAGTLFLHTERFEKEDGSLGAAERGVLYVPLVRGDEASEIISVELWRFQAAEDAASEVPPIFVLRGGPGWPGLARDLEREGYFERWVEPFTRISDVVFVGQRGIGSSKPNTVCEGPPAFPEDAEPTQEERVRAIRDAASACRGFWEDRGLDLSGFNVIEAAGDVNDVRSALGYDQIIISGGSFGSHWGMAVMRYHPDIVARAVLSGTEGPNHTYDSPTGVLNVLKRIAADAEDSKQLEGRIPDGGLMAAFRETLERVEREPVTLTVEREAGDSVEVRIDGDAVRRLSDGYLGSIGDRRWEASWPAGVLALYRGDYERAARRLAPNPGRRGGGAWRTASYFMLDCGSGITPEREDRLLSSPAREVVGSQNRFYRAACPAWDADLGNEFRANFDTEIPTVIVHGNWDLATPLENALELAPHFKNSRFVLVQRGSHGALGQAIEEHDSFRQALMHFVATGDMSRVPERIELSEPDWVTPEEARREADR